MARRAYVRLQKSKDIHGVNGYVAFHSVKTLFLTILTTVNLRSIPSTSHIHSHNPSNSSLSLFSTRPLAK